MDYDWEKIGKQLLEYVKEQKDCIHEAEYFETTSIDWFAQRFNALDTPKFLPYYFRARHLIGRRIAKQALFKKGTATHERWMRYMMNDFHDFMLATHREEVTAGRNSQREDEEMALEKVLEALDRAVGPAEGPHAE